MSKTEESKPKNIKKKSGCSKKHSHELAGEISQLPEVKKERRARKATFLQSKKGMDDGARSMEGEKKLRSEIDESSREIVLREAASISRRSRKERKSKTDKAADVDDGSRFPEEASKSGKSEKQRRSRKDKEIVSHPKEGSKKKGESSRKKTQDVQLVDSCGTTGLSAMIEPWALLKAVVKNHREAVHSLKDIMDLQAAKTGDRIMLHQLKKLLRQIDRENSSTFHQSSTSDPLG